MFFHESGYSNYPQFIRSARTASQLIRQGLEIPQNTFLRIRLLPDSSTYASALSSQHCAKKTVLPGIQSLF